MSEVPLGSALLAVSLVLGYLMTFRNQLTAKWFCKFGKKSWRSLGMNMDFFTPKEMQNGH